MKWPGVTVAASAVLLTLAGCALPTAEAETELGPPPTTISVPAPNEPATSEPTSRPPSDVGPGDSSATTGTVGNETAVVREVVDGDTLRLADERRVRIVGIDTPERGQCGFGPAESNMRRLVEGREVVLVPAAKTDTDRYDRLLRYVEVDGVDAGRDQIARGYAIARFDSRDGYGRHAREDDYVALDAATPDPSCERTPQTAPAPVVDTPAVQADGEVFYASCAEARAAGAAPLHIGTPGYRPGMDGDGDGIACETPR